MALELDYLMYILNFRIMDGKVDDEERSWCSAGLKQAGLMNRCLEGRCLILSVTVISFVYLISPLYLWLFSQWEYELLRWCRSIERLLSPCGALVQMNALCFWAQAVKQYSTYTTEVFRDFLTMSLCLFCESIFLNLWPSIDCSYARIFI